MMRVGAVAMEEEMGGWIGAGGCSGTRGTGMFVRLCRMTSAASSNDAVLLMLALTLSRTFVAMLSGLFILPDIK